MNFLKNNLGLHFTGALAAGVAFGLAFCVWFAMAAPAEAASFSITPNTGTYAVGSTFDVTVVLDTQGQSVNAVQMQLSFPADKLQLVSPSVGNSIIEIYTSPPRYDNAAGEVSIVGGIPNGINVKNGLLAKLTFRVRSLGTANLRFTGESQALLNDGNGTNVLNNNSGATFKLELPPSQGPVVLSSTHPDQEAWYRNNNVSLSWDAGLPAAEGYSYTISDNATDVPDDVPESTNTSVDYKSVGDGLHYFHIKALREGRWGGVTHYTIRIDTTPPGAFEIIVIPGVRTFVTKPVLQFVTSDSLSGFDKFEIKVVPLKVDGRTSADTEGELFTEAQDLYQTPELLYGTYEIIVRAYDKAGNTRDQSQRIEITNSFFWFIGPNGITLFSGKQMPWKVFFPILGGALLFLLIIAYMVYRWYRHHHDKAVNYVHPQTVEEKLAELRFYREKYGKLAAMLAVMISFSLIFSFGAFSVSMPAQAAEITPPTIETYSSNIKDDELFYVSGRTVEPNTEVIVHLQSLVDGQAFDFNSISDKRGDWLYRHTSFLPGGQYILWSHAKSGQELSVPSPQVTLEVKPVALDWGGSRITYQTIYLVAITVLAVTVVLLTIFIILGIVMARRRRRQFANNVRLAEEGLRHGFISLKRDLESELALMERATAGGNLEGEQKVRAEQLRNDLKNIEDLVGQELADVEGYARLPHAEAP